MIVGENFFAKLVEAHNGIITCNGNEHYYKNFTELKQTVFDTARNSKMKNFFKLFSVETEFFENSYADGILFAREQK